MSLGGGGSDQGYAYPPSYNTSPVQHYRQAGSQPMSRRSTEDLLEYPPAPRR